MNEFIQVVIAGVLQGSVYALIALGFSLVYRVAGVINLAQGAFCVLAALVMYSLERALGWALLPAGLAAVLGTSLFAAVLGQLTFVPAIGRLSNSGILMLTIGLLTLIEGLILIVWGSQPYALPSFSGEMPFQIAGLRIPSQGPWILGTTVLVMLALWYLLVRTQLGLALRACAENVVAARLMGIGVQRMTLLAFVLAAGIAAVGGVVLAPITSLQFDAGRLFTISGFIAVAIGGLTSLTGAAVGGLLLGVIGQLGAVYVSSLFSDALSLLVLLAVLVFRPNGLFVSQSGRRRTDVRAEVRIAQSVTRIGGRAGWGLGILAAIVLLLLPLIVPQGGLFTSLVITGIVFIAVLGLDVLMGYAGQVSLGQAGFMAIGGYTAAVLATNYGLSPLLATLCGIVLAVACALVLSVVTTRLRGLYLALGTLAFGLLVDSLTTGLVDVTGGPSGLVGIPSFAVGGLAFATPLSNYYLVLGLIIALVILLAGLMRGGFGRALQAIRTDALAAEALGINVVRYKVAAVMISAALAALSGSLYAFFFHFLSPEMVGTSRSLEMVAMLVVGGEATLVGPLIGVALLTLLPTLFQPLATYKTFATGLLLIVFFLYAPVGIFGLLSDAVAWIGRLVAPGRIRAPAQSRSVAK